MDKHFQDKKYYNWNQCFTLSHLEDISQISVNFVQQHHLLVSCQSGSLGNCVNKNIS